VKASTPYCRVYWSILDDPKFDGIRDDMEALGSWTLCLVVADMAYPVPAFWPPTVPSGARESLVRSGLIEDMDGIRFRVHGLLAERENRTQSARDAAAVRWHKEPDADAMRAHQSGNAEVMPSRAEPSIAEASIAPAREGLPHLNSAVSAKWEEATGMTLLASGDTWQRRLDQFCQRHQAYEVAAAITRIRASNTTHPLSPRQLVFAIEDMLEPPLDRKAVRAVESDAEQASASRRRVQATKARIHNLGAHAEHPDPACALCEAVPA
jgi:hypothetical protein